MKKNKSPKPLTSVEWDTCWMAVRYAMGRATITSATLPTLLVEAYHARWSDGQKNQIRNDLEKHLEQFKKFGWESIDHPKWCKFMDYLDTKNHYTAELIDGTTCKLFNSLGKVYPVDDYEKTPYSNIYLVDGGIKRVIEDDEINNENKQ